MRTLGSEQCNIIGLGNAGTTNCTLWKVTLVNGDVLGFTDNSRDVSYGGVTYQAAVGFAPTSVQSTSDGSSDNLEVEGILDSPNITEADLMSGLWDYATVEIFMIDYNNTAAGPITITKGKLGEVGIDGQRFKAQLHGLGDALRQNIGEVTTPICRAQLGDSRCQVDLAPLLVAATVTAVQDRRNFTVSISGAQAASQFDGGKITWLTGENAEFEMEIRTTSGTGPIVIQLQLPMSADVTIGDTATLTPGCLKRLIADCKTRFNNVVNFRGEPYVPGTDQLSNF